MDPMLDTPKNRRRMPVIRLCVLMGLTALLFILVATGLPVAVVVP